MIRKIFTTGLLAVATVLLTISCTKQEDDDINFQEEYTGQWDAQEVEGINAPQTYTVTITSGAGQDEIILNNLYQGGTAVKATVNGFNFSIPQQTSDGISFSGSGKANADFEQITVNFSADDGAQTDEVKAILTPR